MSSFWLGVLVGMSVPLIIDYVSHNRHRIILCGALWFQAIRTRLVGKKLKDSDGNEPTMIGRFRVLSAHEYDFNRPRPSLIDGYSSVWRDRRNPRNLPHKSLRTRVFGLLLADESDTKWVQFVSGDIEPAHYSGWPFNVLSKYIEREGIDEVLVSHGDEQIDITDQLLRMETPEQNFGGAPIKLKHVYQLTKNRWTPEDEEKTLSFDVSTVAASIDNIAATVTLHELDTLLSLAEK